MHAAPARGTIRSRDRDQHAPSPLLRWVLSGALLVAIVSLWIFVTAAMLPWRDPIGLSILWAYAGFCSAALLLALARALLGAVHRSAGARVLAVARIVIDEGVRRRGALATFSFLLLIIASLATLSPPDVPIEYRLRTFLTYAIDGGAALLSLLTILIACATTAGDVSERHVFVLLVKPLPRFQYLVGKWLGIVLLSFPFLAGLGVASCGLAYAQRAAHSAGPAGVATERVLLARRTLQPAPDPPIAVRLAAELERTGVDPPRTEEEQAAIAALRENLGKEWRSVSPGERDRFVFRSIPPGLSQTGALTLHLRPQMYFARHRASDRETRMEISLNGHRIERRVEEEDIYFDVGRFVAEGKLELEIHNPGASGEDPSMFFWGRDSLEIFYTAGGFPMNLTRALLILWCKLSFLAWLGVFLGSQLGFPVACLTAVIVAGIAGNAQFILADAGEVHDHAHEHGVESDERIDQRLLERTGAALEGIGRAVARVLERFGTYQPSTEVAAGRIVEWRHVGACALWIGILWSGVVAALAIVLFGRRELARVQV